MDPRDTMPEDVRRIYDEHMLGVEKYRGRYGTWSTPTERASLRWSQTSERESLAASFSSEDPEEAARWAAEDASAIGSHAHIALALRTQEKRIQKLRAAILDGIERHVHKVTANNVYVCVPCSLSKGTSISWPCESVLHFQKALVEDEDASR